MVKCVQVCKARWLPVVYIKWVLYNVAHFPSPDGLLTPGRDLSSVLMDTRLYRARVASGQCAVCIGKGQLHDARCVSNGASLKPMQVRVPLSHFDIAEERVRGGVKCLAAHSFIARAGCCANSCRASGTKASASLLSPSLYVLSVPFRWSKL